MSDEFLTVSALRTTVEAELIRGKLQTAGIPATLVEPEPAADGAPAGRVQVQVSQPDFERAMQVLFPIPKITPAARVTHPAWKCPKCGEEVMGSFPLCWSCGTPRAGTITGAAPLPTVQPATAGSVPPPPLPLPPMPAAPLSAAPLSAAPLISASLPPAPLISAPLISAPVTSAPIPAAPPPAPPQMPSIEPISAGSSTPFVTPRMPAELPGGLPPPAAAISAKNGETTDQGVTVPRRSRSAAAEDDLKIVVPAWDPTTSKSGRGSGAAKRREPTDADDRAARRAWWCSVLGIPCPPLLVYSIGVVLILAFSNRPLSARGSRFFYGALALNALIVAAGFLALSRLR